ncbi:MAG: helix-turn-helix transcriptional regulator [Pseudomonadota bacterium]
MDVLDWPDDEIGDSINIRYFFSDTCTMADTEGLVNALKRLLRGAGLTYADVARHMSVSESTVKRWFAERNFSLQRVDAFCELLGLEWHDIIQQSQSDSVLIGELSLEQEQALVEDARLLLVGYLLLQRWSADQILARYDVGEHELTQLLAQLDRLRIIELQPGNRVRTLVAPNFRWRNGGPLEQLFESRVRDSFFDSEFDRPGEIEQFLYGMLSDEAILHINTKIRQLAEDYVSVSQRDRMVPLSRRHGTSMVVAFRRWGFPAFDALKRKDGVKG